MRASPEGQIQGVAGLVELPIDLPGVAMIDQVLHLGQLVEELLHRRGFQGLGELVVELVVALEQLADRADRLLQHLADGVVRIERGLLGDVADPDPLHRNRVALEVLVLSGHDPEQRGLAGAVVPDHPDLSVGKEGEGDVLQDVVIVVALVEPSEDVHELLAHGRDPLGGVTDEWNRSRPGRERGSRVSPTR